MSNTTKKELRERILALLRNHKEEERSRRSLLIKNKLFQLREFQKALTILFYYSYDGEVETLEMIRQSKKSGKKVALPVVDRRAKEIFPTIVDDLSDLTEGPYGIKEPRRETARALAIDEVDLVVVPGVAFDKANHRLGRGKGYYDRFLKRLPKDIPTVGLAFDFQLIDSLPQKQDHDVAVRHVLVG